jgi:hypothetical protein
LRASSELKKIDAAVDNNTKSIARFNVPGRKRRKMADGIARGDNVGSVKPRIAKLGYVRFLTIRDLDGRSRAAQRCRELVTAFTTDLGGHLTTSQSQLVQRASILATQLEDFEVRWSLGEPIEQTDYLTTVNVQRRVLATLGLERRARDVSNTMNLMRQKPDWTPLERALRQKRPQKSKSLTLRKSNND